MYQQPLISSREILTLFLKSVDETRLFGALGALITLLSVTDAFLLVFLFCVLLHNTTPLSFLLQGARILPSPGRSRRSLFFSLVLVCELCLLLRVVACRSSTFFSSFSYLQNTSPTVPEDKVPSNSWGYGPVSTERPVM